MFSAQHRLSRTAFTQYFKAGRRYQTPALTLVYSPLVPFGVAVVVGKKVSKLAVGRNRVRRRLYAGTRRLFDATAVTTGVYIVIAKPSVASYTREALATELAVLLSLPVKSIK